jgi:hypothetical protein
MKIRNIILPLLLLVFLMLSGCAYEGNYDWRGGYDYAPYEYNGGFGFYGYSPFYYHGGVIQERHEFHREHHESSHGPYGEHHGLHGFRREGQEHHYEFHGGRDENHEFH